ncbi:hypothetical protein [Kaistella jeonii]|uniref:Uncharacterized protein n=1 Tax=Kaistella jeonii TaxID=266749 RepID=A0A0C1F566_9FLAO|nr:hypothetical protein [Kaistella jeonii]KIA88347.1 hypothetical protein OA86_11540 [Kaistella jeonii]SFC23351.1 hypothetical protein SAMN05421876_11036 [Kaistella jeonii]VEI94553.1 Uncharacterised protein [Kaistella jeonii]
MKYYIAVYEKLREIYLSQGAMENDLPMICPSLRMYENEDLELLKPASLLNDEQKKTESILKKQNISYELNSVPISAYFWDLNVNTALFDIYRDILDHSNIRDFEQNFMRISVSSSTVLNDAKNADTKEYKNYKKYRIAYDSALEKITDHLSTFEDLTTDEEKMNWKDQFLSMNNLKELAMSEWKVRGSKDFIEKELTRINANSDADLYLAMSRDAKFSFDSAERTDINTFSAIHDINFIPYDFMENESGWNSLKLNKQEMETLYLAAKNSNQNLSAEILSIDYDENGIESIEVDYSFVHLKRSWFNKNFMLSPFFEWKESKPISDGVTISDGFKLPAITKTMMLIKNLKIILDSSVSSTDVNDPNKLIFFGPMIMKQQLFINKNNNERFLKVVTDKKMLQSDQLSYLSKKATPQTVNIRIPGKRPQIFESTTGDPVIPVFNTIKVDRMKMGTVLTSRQTFNVGSPLQVEPRRPVTPLPNPVEPIVPKTIPTNIKLISAIFVPLNLPIFQHLSNVTFRIIDNKNNEPVYKCNISIIGTNSNNESNRIFNIESDQSGSISQNLPIGDYNISFRIDEYAVLEAKFNVPNTNPLTLEYKLQRKQIQFKSFFLIGMICEKMPKIPAT